MKQIDKIVCRIKKVSILVLLTVIVVGLSPLQVNAAQDTQYETKPVRKSNNQKWKIGYLQGGDYVNYPANLKALINGLTKLGWIEPLPLPQDTKEPDARALWLWMAKNLESGYLEFVKDAFWDSKWDKKLRQEVKKEVLTRLKQKNDIDLMLAMGTWAGQDLANDQHSIPTIVLSSSAPLRSKIIKDYKDSGFDHLNARCDPDRYVRQLKIFHDIIGFTKLGIVYETNTEEGRAYAAIEDVNAMAEERQFEVISCHSPFSNIPQQEASASALKCYQKIADQVDALYITTHRGITTDLIPKLLKPYVARKIPTFSQKGSKEVRQGVLMSMARGGFNSVGFFHAETIARIFNGAKPRDLPQIFEDKARIALNLKTAQQIDWDPPIDILGAADEIYDHIEISK